MSVIKCHQQFRAAAKCTGSPMQACLREGWKYILGWTGRPSAADRSNKVAESRRSRRVCGLSPERTEKAAAKCREHIRETRIHMPLDMKDNIAEAARRLLMENNVKKLTVKDIVEECQITRQTFYYHFQDVYDLVEWICIQDTEKVLQENRTYATWKEGFLSVFELAKQDKIFIDNIYHSVSLELLEQYLYRLVYPLLKNVVDEKSCGWTISDEEKKYIADFYKYAFVGVLLEWIRDDMREQPEEIVERVGKIADGTIELALKNFGCK